MKKLVYWFNRPDWMGQEFGLDSVIFVRHAQIHDS
jgi:hypothetical protein